MKHRLRLVVTIAFVGAFGAHIPVSHGRAVELGRPAVHSGGFEQAAPTTTTTAPKSSPTFYIEIPLVGTFGEDFDETGVRDALKGARGMNIQHVVFVLDSPGGSVSTAQKIAEVMRENDDRFQYYCRIRRAISASLWVVVKCDRVYFENPAVTGAAVCYTGRPETGSAAVDAKFTSSTATTLAGYAEAKEQVPSLLVRAMVDPEVTVHVRQTESGAELSDSVDSPADGWRTLDSPTQVLSLTAREALDLGFGANWADRDIATDGWRLAGRIGQTAIAKSKKRCEDLQKARDWMDRLDSFLDQANNTPPASSFSDYVYDTVSEYDRSGRLRTTQRLSPASANLWAQRDRQYRAAWSTVTAGLDDIHKLLKRYDDSDRPEWLSGALASVTDAKRLALEKQRRK